jgi:hypothetical protein
MQIVSPFSAAHINQYCASRRVQPIAELYPVREVDALSKLGMLSKRELASPLPERITQTGKAEQHHSPSCGLGNGCRHAGDFL